MMKKDEKGNDGLRDQDDRDVDPDHDDEGGFDQHREHQLAHVEADSRGDVGGSITMVHLMEYPQALESVIRGMPQIDCQIEEHERDHPLQPTIIPSA